MARQFRVHTGHPLVFWTGVLLFVFSAFSATRASTSLNACDGVGTGAKHWQVLPPRWICGAGHIQLTSTP